MHAVFIAAPFTIHLGGDSVDTDDAQKKKKRKRYLLTPISNYSILCTCELTQKRTALKHANVTFEYSDALSSKQNKFIFFYIIRNDCGQNWEKRQNVWFQYSRYEL